MTFVAEKHPRDAHGRFATTPGEADAIAKEVAGPYSPLPGLPTKSIKLGDQYYTPGPNAQLKQIAENYMRSTGREYTPPATYEKVDPDRAKRIAQAFDEMQHAPNDPVVKAAYAALFKETAAQYRALESAGIKVEFIKPGQKDPYADSPRRAAMDVAYNKHLWAFPTDQGFGSDKEMAKNNPALADSGIEIDGRPATNTEVFRVVHDLMGHFKDGNGFRADGEENAWRAHSAMYSPLARQAMTAVTRGQNSWVNFGPYGDHNRTASVADTHFAPEKMGLMPSWVVTEGSGTGGDAQEGRRDTRPDIGTDMSWEGIPANQNQPIKTMDELYDRSKKEEASFRANIEQMAAQSGATAKFPPATGSEPGTLGLKTMKRANRKAVEDYKGDVTQIRDVLRASIIGDTVLKARNAAADFIASHNVTRIKDRFEHPSMGYRDIMVNFRTPSGLVAEVQFGSKTILDAKMGDGHKIYTEIQNLKSPSNRLSKEDRDAELQKLETTEVDLYTKAYNADGNGSWKKKP
jgi:hypothetical protein